MTVSASRRNRYAQEAVIEQLRQENEGIQAQLFHQQTELIDVKLKIESFRNSKSITDRELRAEFEHRKRKQERAAQRAATWARQHDAVAERRAAK
jgi:hypothetical protein